MAKINDYAAYIAELMNGATDPTDETLNQELASALLARMRKQEANGQTIYDATNKRVLNWLENAGYTFNGGTEFDTAPFYREFNDSAGQFNDYAGGAFNFIAEQPETVEGVGTSDKYDIHSLPKEWRSYQALNPNSRQNASTDTASSTLANTETVPNAYNDMLVNFIKNRIASDSAGYTSTEENAVGTGETVNTDSIGNTGYIERKNGYNPNQYNYEFNRGFNRFNRGFNRFNNSGNMGYNRFTQIRKKKSKV